MKNNGFTLIELLGVIVILGILITIVTISVNNVLNSSETKLTQIQIEKVKEAAKNYYINEGMGMYDFEQNNFSHCVSVNYLIQKGYIDNNEVSNFETNENMLGSVRISYESNKYKYTYVEDNCKLCSVVSDIGSEGLSIGDKYQCRVKDNMEKDFKNGYYFYILGENNDGTVNLIMDRNICEDGTVTEPEKEDKCLVAYNETGEVGEGPVTAITYLNNATGSWENIPNLNITYNDEEGNFTNYKITGKSRMPYLSEVNNYDETNGYLYNNLHIDCYENDTSSTPVACKDAGYIDGIYEEGIEHINEIYGYWLISSLDYSSAYFVAKEGTVNGIYVNTDVTNGVRPVITINKDILENEDRR